MVVWLLGAALATGHNAAAAAPRIAAATPSVRGHVDVIQLGGLIDPVEADFLSHAVAGANSGGALALIVVLDSGGGVISQARVAALATTVARSAVPVAVWVGPNGARASGASFTILQAAALRGMAPGTRVGQVAGTTLGDQQALARHVVTISAPTFGDFLVSLDGQPAGPGGGRLRTADVIHAGGELRRQPSVDSFFKKLSLQAQLLHTVASPSAAYLLLLIGLLLGVLEFFTAGIGIAAACGAGCLALVSYGFGVLPLRPYALALVVVAVFGFAIDVQAGTPRVWTVIGTVALVAGTVRLYAGLHLSLLAMVAGVIGTVAFMIGGMPAMLRARFSTPTIGRQSMIGEMGIALAAIEPEGTVQVRGAPWRARTNRATPIASGANIRVVAIDGLLLEVEPEVGGARDARH
jgi:membrane-bound serine protease (ClpP class)